MSIREKVWNGKLPISVKVTDPIALGTHEYLFYASRLSYLPLYTGRILNYLRRYLDEPHKDSVPTDWWFEYDGKPLPWNRPIGLLQDVLIGHPTGQPWSIELKRGEYPADKILTIDADDTLLNYWTNQFKESSYIRDGNARAVMLMPREEQEALWRVVLSSSRPAGFNDEFMNFWKYTDPLIRKSTSDWNVPLRLYSSAFKQPVIQKLVPASDTLGRFLDQVLPDISTSDVSHSSEVQPILHGVVVPRSADLGRLYSEAMYMDGFLHISILFV